MKKILLIASLLFSGCIITTGSVEKDNCCFNICQSYEEDVHFALWQGDDYALNITRCGCFIYPNDFELTYTAPLGTCEGK